MKNIRGKWKERKLVVTQLMSGQVPKSGLEYWKLREWKLTLHLINVAEINDLN